MKRRRAGYVLLVALLGASCGPHEVSDTGYVGTWAHGGPNAQSIISIVRDGESYRFRWRVVSNDGKWSVDCDWDGNCEEKFDGQTTVLHVFRPFVDPRTGHLKLDITREHVRGPERRVSHSVDLLELEPGGLALWSYTVERDGKVFEGDHRPKRKLDKVSDRVADPPRGAGR